jgi:hypothetical protein
MYQKYIDAIYINPDVNLSKIARQNRIIDRVVNLYIQDPVNFKQVYESFIPDIVEDDYRANHYGVKIGTVVGWNLYKGKDFYDKVAKIKRNVKKDIRNLVLK